MGTAEFKINKSLNEKDFNMEPNNNLKKKSKHPKDSSVDLAKKSKSVDKKNTKTNKNEKN
jgi:hypothetical protein